MKIILQFLKKELFIKESLFFENVIIFKSLDMLFKYFEILKNFSTPPSSINGINNIIFFHKLKKLRI